VLVFTDFLLGNVAPKRTLKNKEIPGASDISVNQEDIIILNTNTQRILVFDKKANSRALPDKRMDDVKKVIDLPSGQRFIAMAALDSHSFYLLKDNGAILVIDSKGVRKIGQVVGAYDLSFRSRENAKEIEVLAPEGVQTLPLP
jgi:hypothetical protein